MVKLIAVSVNEEEFKKITEFCEEHNIIRSRLMRDLTIRYIDNVRESEKEDNDGRI